MRYIRKTRLTRQELIAELESIVNSYHLNPEYINHKYTKQDAERYLYILKKDNYLRT